jgi:hypothetical protein
MNLRDAPFQGTTMQEAEANLRHLTLKDGIDDASLPLAGTAGTPSGRQRFLFGQSTSGLSAAHVREATHLVQQAAILGYHERQHIGYTQGGRRWCISTGRRAIRGQFPSWGDCSGFASWTLWCGLTHIWGAFPDIVNGEHWRAGFTGTMEAHGRRVSSPFPGCCVFYGDHVAVYTGGGLVVSHGSQAGPLLLPWRYRRPLSIRSYIA